MTDDLAVRTRIAGEPPLRGTPSGGLAVHDAFVRESSPVGASVRERDDSGSAVDAAGRAILWYAQNTEPACAAREAASGEVGEPGGWSGRMKLTMRACVAPGSRWTVR